MSSNFDLDALFQELGQIPKGDEGLRSVEIRKHLTLRGLPHSEKWLNARLNELHEQGRVVVGHRLGTNLGGQMCQFTVYRLKREPKTSARRKVK